MVKAFKRKTCFMASDNGNLNIKMSHPHCSERQKANVWSNEEGRIR